MVEEVACRAGVRSTLFDGLPKVAPPDASTKPERPVSATADICSPKPNDSSQPEALTEKSTQLSASGR